MGGRRGLEFARNGAHQRTARITFAKAFYFVYLGKGAWDYFGSGSGGGVFFLFGLVGIFNVSTCEQFIEAAALVGGFFFLFLPDETFRCTYHPALDLTSKT